MDDTRPKVAALVRVSTAAQAGEDRAGIARQHDVIDRTIAQRDLDCVQRVELVDVSGTSARECPEIQEILAGVLRRELQGIVVADLDRLLRPADIEEIALLQVFQTTGAIIYCGDQTLDLSSDDGCLLGIMQAALAGHELRLIKRRMQGGKERKRRDGKCPGSEITLPLGVSYDRKKEAYFYNDEIVRVQEAFRLLDTGVDESLSSVARLTGVTPRGLRVVLANKIYIGVREYAYKRGDKYVGINGRQAGRKKIKRLPEDIISVRVIEEPAVDPERFERVQKILRTKKGRWEQVRKAGRIHLGTGLLRCGHCGALLVCKAGGRRNGRWKTSYYGCKHNSQHWRKQGLSCTQRPLPDHELEKRLLDFAGQTLSDPMFLESLITRCIGVQLEQAKLKDSGATSSALEEKRLVKKLERMKDLYLAGGYESVQAYMTEKAEVEKSLRAVQSAMRPPSQVSVSSMEQAIKRIARGAMAVGRCTDPEKQLALLRALLAEVVVRDEDFVEIKLAPQVVTSSVSKKNTRTGRGSWPPPA